MQTKTKEPDTLACTHAHCVDQKWGLQVVSQLFSLLWKLQMSQILL